MEQGTGKTRVAIELIHSTDADFVLFLCPFSTKDNLQSEIDKWKLERYYKIIGYETISSSDRQYLELLESIKGKVFIVADESIFIKNEETKRFDRVMKLAESSEYRLILNGTPVTKNEWDIYNQMLFLSPKIIDMSREEFLNNFFTRVQYKKKFEKPREFYKLSEVNVDYLHKLIEPYVFNVGLDFDKEILLKKKLVYSSVEVEQEYSTIKERLLNKIKMGEQFLDELSLMSYITFTDQERCKTIAGELKGQVIVFCSYLKEVEQILSYTDAYVITGDTNQQERTNTLERFKNDNKPLIMTYGVGSYGLNLQFCNRVAFASLTFDYGKVEQAQARIKRVGQTRDIEYTYFTSDLGIYDLIEQNIENKTNLSELMVERVKEVMNNEEISKK